MKKEKKLPLISFKEFDEIVNLIKQQEKKDHEFADFMEGYLDGRCIPTMSEYNAIALIKLLSYIFDDRKSEETWMEWFFYETDFGEHPMSAYLGETEYVISGTKDMYEFMILWMNLPD